MTHLPVTYGCPIFKRGDKVICRSPPPYSPLREGNTYTVYDYEPRYVDVTFTWPAYVHVITRDYQGRLARIVCHASRFIPA